MRLYRSTSTPKAGSPLRSATAVQGAGFLETILVSRCRDVAEATAGCDLSELACEAERIRERRPRLRLRSALTERRGVNVIAEFKRASPSLGIIHEKADPREMARTYDAAGACGISILTEPNFFRGSLDDLRAARAVTALPILRKDFVVHTQQIDEAAIAGADAVLLIVAALSNDELERFRARAEDALGLDTLVEVHTIAELDRAIACGARLIGVNNRDLRTFKTSLEISEQIAAAAPEDVTLVSESGISSPADVARLRRCGFAGLLIGESLMRSADPAALLRALREVEAAELRHV